MLTHESLEHETCLFLRTADSQQPLGMVDCTSVRTKSLVQSRAGMWGGKFPRTELPADLTALFKSVKAIDVLSQIGNYHAHLSKLAGAISPQVDMMREVNALMHQARRHELPA